MEKVATRRSKRQNNNGNGKNTDSQEYKEVQPLIVKPPPASVSPKVKMEVIKLKPVVPVARIQKARRGLPFHPSCRPGQKRSDVCVDKKSESSDLQTDDVNISVQKPGDESIELEETSYEQWLAAEGLVQLQDQGQDIRKINDVNIQNEDASKQDASKQDDSKQDDSKQDNSKEDDSKQDNSKEDDSKQGDSVINEGDKKQDEKAIMISKMDKMKRDVEEMLSKNEGQADSEERIRRLQNILQLLDNNNELNTEKKGQDKKMEEDVARKTVKENELEKGNIEHKKESVDLSKGRAEKDEEMKQTEKEEVSKKNVNIEKQDDIKQAHGMQDSAIRKIGVIVDENLYTLDSSTDNIVIADVSNTGGNSIKKVHFNVNEASTCESEVNSESKIIDSTAETIDMSTLTSETPVQDTTSQEEINDTLSIHEEEEDDDDYDIPLTQNVQSQRYLKYKPDENIVEDEYDEDANVDDESIEGYEELECEDDKEGEGEGEVDEEGE